MIRQFLLTGVLIPGITLSGCAASGGGPGTRVAPPQPAAACTPFKERALRAIGPYTEARRLTVYSQINGLAPRLMGCRVVGKPTERTVPALAPTPLLALVDLDGDGLADGFVHKDSQGQPTQDQGLIFDLNHDGKADYVVLIGGWVLTPARQPALLSYHQIDTDHDGQIDTVVFPVDRDEDGFLDEDVTAWVYDRNHDGRIDSGDYLGVNVQQPIPTTAQGVTIKTLGRETVLSTQAPLLQGLSQVLQAINQQTPPSKESES